MTRFILSAPSSVLAAAAGVPVLAAESAPDGYTLFGSNAGSVADRVALAKARPGQITHGSNGIGSSQRLQSLARRGVEARGTTAQELADFIRAETAKWAKVVKASGARAD